MNQSKFVQRGNIAFEFAIISMALILMGVVGLAHTHYQIGKNEITVDQYQKLNALAKESCSGGAYLKNKAVLGPLKGKDFDEIYDELQRLAESQARLNARSTIINQTPVCS